MAGLATISGEVRVDLNGLPVIGALAYFFAGGTTTPLTVYQDYGLGAPHPFPLTTDGYGYWPDIYLNEADEFYRLRITDTSGSLLRDTDGIPIIGPSGGGGGGGGGAPVDPTALMKTGDTIHRISTGNREGFVIGNGSTLGNTSSGATYADAENQALFEFFWPVTQFAVSGGRGVSALADWNANRRLTLPDYRYGMPIGLDSMGSSARFGITNGTILGRKIGAPTVSLTEAQNGPHASNTNPATTQISKPVAFRTAQEWDETGSDSIANVWSGYQEEDRSHFHTGVSSGSGAPHENMPPGVLGTWYIKL